MTATQTTIRRRVFGEGESLSLGQLAMTPGFMNADGSNPLDLIRALRRHAHGDWGDVCDEDWETNNWSVENDARVLSAYELPSSGIKFWVITEADRSSTTVLLPEEY